MGPRSQELDRIREAQKGNRDAFNSLLERYRDPLEYFARMRLGPQLKAAIEVDDIIQETCLRAYRSLVRFKWEGEKSMFRWLKGIAEHVILEAASQQRRRPIGPLNRDEEGGDTSQGRALRREERFDRLQEAFYSLSPEQRRVILLCRMRRLPLSEVAERMKRSPAAVKQLLWRSLQKLRSAFGETESLHLPDRSLEDGGERDSV